MNSIRKQLTITLLAGFALLLGGGSILIYYSVRAALYEKFDSKLRFQALAIISATKQERKGIDVEFSDRYMLEFSDDRPSEFYQLWHPSGKVIERSASLDKKSELPQRFGTMDEPTYWNFEMPNGQPVRAVGIQFVPHADRGDRKHHNPDLKLGLVVAGDRRDLDRSAQSLATTLGFVTAGSLICTLALVPILLRRGLSPLDQVAEYAANINATNLQARFPTKNLPEELQPICTRLNELLGRLEQSFERERRFSADVAHELRTPIAELRSLSEVALKWPSSDPSSSTAFEDSLQIAKQMETIVTSLLAISRCESAKQTVVGERIELAPFVSEQWAPYRDKAAKKQLTVSLNIPGAAAIQADRAMLSLILSNLFSNAVDYSPNSGCINIQFHEEAEQQGLIISNTTKGLTEADIPHLFERFWRKDNARSSSEHSGIGLALAKAYAQALGFSLTAELIQPDRIAFNLKGPRLIQREQAL